MLAEGSNPKFFNLRNISQTFVLELIEGFLLNNESTISRHPEQVQVIRHRLMSLALKTISEKQAFGLYVRVIRILTIIMRTYMESMLDEFEKALDLLTRSLDADIEGAWKRAVSTEFYRIIYSDFGLLRRIYAHFDKVDGRKKIIGNSLGAFVRLASENPALIGLSHQSTIPHAREPTKESEEQAAIDALGITGVVSSTASAEASVTGISMEWSRMQTACIEQPERATAPQIPDTYVYSVVIDCLSAFSDGLARFIMPLSVPRDSRSRRQHQALPTEPETSASTEEAEPTRLEPNKITRQPSGRKYQMLVNPLTLEKLPQLEEVKICVVLIESCWPAYLAASTTFLYAALDSDFYHSLIRSFQKLTQVSGILGLNTPRDALLTSLGKATIPVDSGNAMSPVPRQRNGWSRDDFGSIGKGSQLLSVLSPTLQSPTAESPRQSMDLPRSSLSTRNLLCLRALLNLGIALGPTLNEDAWSILLETLQQAEIVIKIATQLASRRSSTLGTEDDHILPKNNMGNELVAVQTATSRMFESTKEYPSDSFTDLVSALLRLAGVLRTEENDSALESQSPSGDTPMPRRGRMHQASRSVSMTLSKYKAHDAELNFVIERCRVLCLVNMQRFASSPKVSDIWSEVVRLLLSIMKPNSSADLRLKSADSLNELIVALAKMVISVSEPRLEKAHIDCLSALKSQCTAAFTSEHNSTSTNTISLEIHDKALTALESLLENSGERLATGWTTVFDLIKSCFEGSAELTDNSSKKENGKRLYKAPTPRSDKLLRTSFRSLQMVGSDFLALLPATGYTALVDTLSLFGRQDSDMNISLTTTTLYWDVVNFVQDQLGSTVSASNSTGSLNDIGKETVLTAASNGNRDEWLQALWLYLLSSLTELTVDSRLDVRNSALRVLLRVFEAHGQYLTSTAWQFCLEFIILKTFEEQTTRLLVTTNVTEATSWEDSLIALNEGLGRLLGTFVLTIMDGGDPFHTWNKLFQIQARQLQEKPSARIFSSVCGLIVEVLEALKNGEMADSRLLDGPYRLWSRNHPTQVSRHLDDPNEVSENDTSKGKEAPTQQAALAFIDAFVAIYTFKSPPAPFIDPSNAIDAIQEAIFTCSHTYGGDFDQPSVEQAKALFVIPKLYDAFKKDPSKFMRHLFRFAEAFLGGIENSDGHVIFNVRRPSYMAFSASSISLIRTAIVQKSQADEILEKWAVIEALDCLTRIIKFKHVEVTKEQKPSIWQIATNAAVDIIEHVTSLTQLETQKATPGFYDASIKVAKAVLFTIKIPELAPDDYLARKPEDFDVQAFQRLHSALVPAMGESNVSETVRRNYATTVFVASLVHKPKRHDLPPATDLLETPLGSLYQIRHADVIEPRPAERLHVSYAALDALIGLIASPGARSSRRQDTARRISIAKAAAPYIVLRAALPLKSFIADQPVGATLPIPPTITDELTYVLDKLASLESEDAAIPAGSGGDNGTSSGANGKGKRHLRHLYPIFVEFLEVLRALPREMDVMGNERSRLWEVTMRWLKACGEALGVEGVVRKMD